MIKLPIPVITYLSAYLDTWPHAGWVSQVLTPGTVITSRSHIIIRRLMKKIYATGEVTLYNESIGFLSSSLYRQRNNLFVNHNWKKIVFADEWRVKIKLNYRWQKLRKLSPTKKDLDAVLHTSRPVCFFSLQTVFLILILISCFR